MSGLLPDRSRAGRERDNLEIIVANRNAQLEQMAQLLTVCGFHRDLLVDAANVVLKHLGPYDRSNQDAWPPSLHALWRAVELVERERPES